jgi:hypothetical protein
MTVLLWGRAAEPVIDATARACARLGAHVAAADGEELASVELGGDLVTRDGRRVTLADVTGMLVRPEGHPTSAEAIGGYQALSAWAELTTAAVLNRPSAAASNRSKPYQLGLIAAAGFAVPDTLVTTSPDDVRAFWAEHDKIVYKSISGVRSIVTTLDPQDKGAARRCSRLPNPVPAVHRRHRPPGTRHRRHGARLPHQLSRGRHRYPAASGSTTTMSAVNLRDDVEQRCRALIHTLGLSLAGIDLKLDRHGQWWCLEVNTVPGFIWFENHIGLPITDAVANLLVNGAKTDQHRLPPGASPARPAPGISL